MAKRNIKGKSRGRPGSMLPSIWRLILLLLIAALLFWQWPALTSWANSIATGVWQQFGWGLLLIAIATGTLVGMLWRRRLLSLLRHWNRWLGGVAFALAAWGILAFFPGTGILQRVSLGGSFGQSISGQDIVAYPIFVSILRILGLLITGAILVAPRACIRMIAGFLSRIGEQFRRRPGPVIAKPQPPPTYGFMPALPPLKK